LRRESCAGSIPAASIFVRDIAGVNDFRSFYLLAGLRGNFERDASLAAYTAEVSLLHTLDDRWGIEPPWGACDSGVDLESSGDDVLRGWAHVDLRVRSDTSLPSDVALAGLLRTMWDALELYGNATLTGADAIVPLQCVGDALWTRVAGSVLRDRRHGPERPARVLVQATSNAWPDSSSPPPQHDPVSIVGTLSEFVAVEAAMGAVPFASYPPSFAPSPFAFGMEHPWAASDTDPYRAEIKLPSWTVDDAGWLAEAVCAAYARVDDASDVQVALRLVG